MPTDTAPFIVAVIVGTIGSARIARLWVEDMWPPVLWLRTRVQDVLPPQWMELTTCYFCVAPYISVANVSWAWFSNLHASWWFANLVAATAYVAAMLNLRDTPED